jgi:hypothetical protein
MTRHFFLLVVVASSILLVSCSREPAAPQVADPADPATYAEGQSYTVRGIIAQLPEAGPPPRDFKIHHEHIPDFVGKSGEVHRNPDGTPGMRSMVMAFPNLAPDVSLDGLAVDGKIEFEFRVRWDEDQTGNRTARWLVTRITPLPAETEISFENKTGP